MNHPDKDEILRRISAYPTTQWILVNYRAGKEWGFELRTEGGRVVSLRLSEFFTSDGDERGTAELRVDGHVVQSLWSYSDRRQLNAYDLAEEIRGSAPIQQQIQARDQADLAEQQARVEPKIDLLQGL